MRSRHTFLSLAISSAFVAALFAFVPDAHSHEWAKSRHSIFTPAEPPSVTKLNLPTVKNSTAEKPSYCSGRLALLLAALDSKECS
jgi:hypothetical protein